MEAQRKGLVILFAPALAVALMLLSLLPGRAAQAPRRYGEHLVLAVRRVYRLSLPVALGAAAVLTMTFLVLLLGYRALLFFTTYYSL